MAITRACDYCEKQETVAGFIEHYDVSPTRRPGKGLVMDLCRECSDLLTRPIDARDVKRPVSTEPIVTVDGKGTKRVRRTRNRAGRCTSMLRNVRCIWDEGHTNEHQAANGQHWK